MTWLVYSALALSFAARTMWDLKGTAAQHMVGETDGTVDGMPLVGGALLVVGWAVCREDPLSVFGLSVERLRTCPWPQMLAVWLVAFVAGRLMEARLFRRDLWPLVASGTINPGGTYLHLRGSGLKQAAVVAAGLTFSQTFVEEFLFRGLLATGAGRALKGLGLAGNAAAASGAAASSLAFGLVHFLPMMRAVRGTSRTAAWYSLIVPSCLGGVFCVLNAASGSLWPGWLVHWLLNYSAFIWNKAGGRWEHRAQ